MKLFLRNFSYIALGVLLGVLTTTLLPSTIKSVTAQLSSSALEPLQRPFENISQYPRSTQKNQARIPFALPDVAIGAVYSIHNSRGDYFPKLGPSQMDINGDGLLDLVYSMQSPPNYGNLYTEQYVYLNTGSGFEEAYLCKSDVYSGTTTYRGDCADPNFPTP